MAIFRQGDMLAHLDECDYAYITTNSMVKKDGCLVMGRGIAKQVRDNFKGIDKAFGDAITGQKKHMKEYCLISNHDYPQIRAFQVKFHWFGEADMDLITNSTNELSTYASEFYEQKIFLNLPGVGNGKLNAEDILPIVEQLPDNVTVWSFT